MVGRTISHYQIIAEVGSGGMGTVYTAQDLTLDRTVALKFLLHSLLTDEEAKQRFINEARAEAAIDHPNIGVVHEVDQTDDGQIFIVMAYYEGQSLSEKLEQGRLSIPEAIDYAVQIASGLDCAHEAGIVHRDIKPGNLIVTERDLVKIVDFGISKIRDVNLTRTGKTMGTMAYMSPEQARGNPVDHRTDLWALGVVMYEMLTGEHPFSGDYEAAVLYAVTNTDHAAARSLRPEIPDELERVLNRLLNKGPDERIQSAAEVVDELERVLAGMTSENVVSETSNGRSMSSMFRFGAVFALIAAAGLLWILNRGDSVSEYDRENIRELLDDGHEYARQGQFSLARAAYERAIDFDSTNSTAWSSLAAANTLLLDYDAAISQSRTAIRLDSSSHNAYYSLGSALHEKGLLNDAAPAYSEAIRLDPRFGWAYSSLGDLYIQLDRPLDALAILTRGATEAPASPALSMMSKNIGRTYMALYQYDDAIPYLEQSERLDPLRPETIALLAECYEATGDPARGREMWERYLEIETDPAKRQAVRERLNGG